MQHATQVESPETGAFPLPPLDQLLERHAQAFSDEALRLVRDATTSSHLEVCKSFVSGKCLPERLCSHIRDSRVIA